MGIGNSGRYSRYVRDSAAHVEPNYQETHFGLNVQGEMMGRMTALPIVNNTPARKCGNMQPLQRLHLVTGLQARVNTQAAIEQRALWIDPRMTQNRRVI